MSFPAVDDLVNFHLAQPDSSHYEVIQGVQNLYADFDGETPLEGVLDKVKAFVASRTFRFAVLVFGACDTTKQSYHVVVKGLHFPDHLECGVRAKEVWGTFPSFDASIYTSRRNLRMLGSRKLDSTRVKRLVGIHDFGYYPPDELLLVKNDPFLLTKNSLVSFVDQTRSRLVQGLVSSKPSFPAGVASFGQEPNSHLSSRGAWSQALVHKATLLLNAFFPGVFSFRDSNGGVLSFKRVKPARCPLCERTHDNEGVFLTLGSGAVISLHCRRNEDKRSLPLVEEEETINVQVVADSRQGTHESLVASLVDMCKARCVFY